MLNLAKKKQANNKYTDSNISLYNNNNKIPQYKNQVIITSPSWKEWNNSIYSYNKEYIKLLVHKNKIVNYLFNSYFNLTRKILMLKRKRLNNNKRFSSNRIFLSKAEIKHTNTNVNITLFILNKNKNFMKYKLKAWKTKVYSLYKLKRDTFKRKTKEVYKFNIKNFKSSLYNQINIVLKKIKYIVLLRMYILHNISKSKTNKINLRTKNDILINMKNNIKENKTDDIFVLKNLFMNLDKRKFKHLKFSIKKQLINFKKMFDWANIKHFEDINKVINVNKKNKDVNQHKTKLIKPINSLKNKNFRIYRFLYYYQSLIFNKNKFTNWFLNYKNFGLINLISKIYNKKIEFNIVSLKSVHLNNDIYSESIALKLKNRKNKLLRILKKALFKIKLPHIYNLYNIDTARFGYINKKRNVLNSLKYKLITGARFEASGRLSRRLVASKSIFKFRYVGNLNNIYSSFIGLPSVMLRGYLKSNIQQTIINTKTRNGAFGLKGWTSSY
jgi:hypothetical protein